MRGVILRSERRLDMKTNLKVAQEVNGLDSAVDSYKSIKAKIAFLEEQLKPCKEVIEEAARQTPDGTIITENYKVTLSIACRENFSLKNAKAALGEDALAEFISTSTYTILKVN